ncbi:MAG TPA: acyl-CoA dehydrogenase family protein [Jatrophihabitans sp.]
MDYTDAPDVAEFRAQLRAWLGEHPDLIKPVGHSDEGAIAHTLAWYRALAGAGYVTVSLPAEYGGRGLPDSYEAVVNEELAVAGAPPPPPIGHIAHAIADFASEELKARMLPGLLSCTEVWCQGFSEPGAGSDLAGVSTTALPTEDGTTLRVNGQKIWTSGAMWSDWCLLMARTDPDAVRHKALSMIVVDMTTPGIDRREITMSTGSREFAEVYFDDVVVPVENVVGGLGQGWQIAMGMLAYERGPADMGWVGRIGAVLAAAQQDVRTGRTPADESLRRRLASGWVGLQVLNWHVQRTLARRAYETPGPEGSLDKLLATRVEQEVYATLLDLAGADVLAEDGAAFSTYLYSRAQSIYGGTQQIQRTIVAQRLLGLPR